MRITLIKTALPALLSASLVMGLLSGCGADSDDENEAENTTFTIKGGLGQGATLALATDGIDPSTLELKVHRVGFSTSEYCTDPTIMDASGEYQDFANEPTLGQGDLAIGTYKCIIIEMGSMIRFTPAETSDNNYCVAGEEMQMDVCQEGATGTDMDGNDYACEQDNDDVATLYLSTAAEEPGDEFYSGDSYVFSAPPTASDSKTGGSPLTAALEVTADSVGQFVAGMLGMIRENPYYGQGGQGSDIDCEMNEPTWSFTNE